MTQTNDGGPAFPCDSMKQFPTQEGMSLRDWFAGQALASMDTDGFTLALIEAVVRRAYVIADAMLAERAKERE